MTICIKTIGTVLLLAGLWSGAQAAGGFDQVVVERLSNGMPVILLENHKAPVVTFQVWYRAGSRNDPWGKSGLAHVLEHMMFKGTHKVSGEAFTRTIQANGGNYNAFTTQDYAAYFETMAADKIGIALELEADRMQHLVLRENEFETEKRVVMEERRMRVADSPQAFTGEQLRAAAFQAQTYHWPVIGWTQDLQRMTVEDARRQYHRHYNPANAFIVAVGDFDAGAFLSRVEKTFGTIPAGEPPDQYRYHEPPQAGERQAAVHKNAQLPYWLTGFYVPTIGDPDAYVLEVIAAILSAGKSSRLYEHLVLEKELALSAEASYSLLSIDPNLFYLSGEPTAGTSVAQVQGAVMEEIERLKTTPAAPEELKKAQNQLETGFIFSQDSFFYQAMLLARYQVTVGWERIRQYVPGIRAVTSEDVMRVARKYFVPQRRTTAVLHPEQSAAPPPGETVPPKKPGGKPTTHSRMKGGVYDRPLP